MKNMSTINSNQQKVYTNMATYHAGVMQASAHRALQKQSDLILKPYAITKTQWLLIGTVLDSGAAGIRLSELAVILNTTLAYLTNAINLLESKNILVRTISSSDSRAKFVTIHPDFAPKCAEIEATFREGLRSLIYNRISRSDFNIYMKVLHQLSVIDKHASKKSVI